MTMMFMGPSIPERSVEGADSGAAGVTAWEKRGTMAKKNAQRKDDSERPAERPRRSMPRWLRRAICFAGSVFLMFCAVYMFFIMVIEGYGLPIGIVGTIVFSAMAIHLFRAGLTDGQWRVER